MDYQVDVVCAATAGKLMIKGVAEILHVKPGDPKTACSTGFGRRMSTVRGSGLARPISICSRSRNRDLIPECAGMMGAATMIAEMMDGSCRVLTY